MPLNYNVTCDKNVIVNFILYGHNVENMDVNIYHTENEETHLLSHIKIRNEIIVSTISYYAKESNDCNLYNNIGIECVERIQKNPKEILG